MQAAPPDPGSRPKSALLVLLWFCVENLVRVIWSLELARSLPDLPTLQPPLYIALSSAFWFAAFAVTGAVVALRRPRATAISFGVMGLYQAYLWFNRLVLSRSSEAVETLGFRAILTLLSFVILAGALIVSRVWRPFGRRIDAPT